MNAFAKLILLAAQVLLCLFLASLASGDEPPAVIGESAKYEQLLNMTLRVGLDEEKAYIHEVVTLVRQGRLPKKLVDKSVVWVRDNCADDDYYFVYFERILRRQAERLKFKVPRFDYDVYASNR